MYNIFAIVSAVVLFLGIMVVFTQEKLDYVAFSIFAAIISCIITTSIYGTTFEKFLEYIEWEPLFFVIAMQIIIVFIEKEKIFQWLAIKILHITKGNHRIFFYLICATSTISAAFIEDITVTMIFIPLIIRACKILKIDPTPYLFGFAFTIVIGSSLTPFSSSENILIAHAFDLDFIWFLFKIFPFVLPALLLTLVGIDFMFLKKIAPPEEFQKQILMEIMNPALVIINRRKFILNSIYFGLTIIGLILFKETYLIASIGAILMCILNKSDLGENLKKIDWKIIFFFIALFLMIGSMEENGTFELISNWIAPTLEHDVFVAAIIILVLTALLSGILANVPTTLVFITLIENIYGFGQSAPQIIYIAFLLGVNLGANLLPQGSASVLITLNFATKNKIKGFNYKSLLKNGIIYTVIHIIMSLVYLFLIYLVI
ncbi:MAG: SLC13 family permease [Promethearchaeota archaeon]